MRRRLPDLVLALVTVVWGSTFLVAQLALREIGPFGFLAVRFSIATFVLLAACGHRLKGLTRTELRAGLGIGLTLFAAYALQTVGLLHTTSSKSAFITALYVPLVPVFGLIVLRRRPGSMAWIGAAVSFAGLALLSIRDGLDLGLGFGEWLTLGCAVASALQIVLIGKHAPNADAVRLTTVQLALVSGLSLVAMPLASERFPLFSPSLLAECLGMGVVATALALLAMNWAQRIVPPTRATLIYAMEPVWAAVVGMFAGERLTPWAIGGSILILLGMMVAEVPFPRLVRQCA